jgi:hypothetical protein
LTSRTLGLGPGHALRARADARHAGLTLATDDITTAAADDDVDEEAAAELHRDAARGDDGASLHQVDVELVSARLEVVEDSDEASSREGVLGRDAGLKGVASDPRADGVELERGYEVGLQGDDKALGAFATG